MPLHTPKYDESDEDRPRIVLDTNGDFTLPFFIPPTFKLHELDPTRFLLGYELLIWSLRPVPKPSDVSCAKAAMGHGRNGVWTGTRFEAADSPASMFPVCMVNTVGKHLIERFCIHRRFVPQVSGLKTMLIYIDGACSNNGSPDKMPHGGCAFVFNDTGGRRLFSLEKKGADDQPHVHTSNRAELRAVIEALHFRDWWGEGWQRVIIATDSEYVDKGATEWLRTWAGRGWRTSGGKKVANRDLWIALSEALRTYAESGCEVSFWMVPRNSNKADADAKAAAEIAISEEEYQNQSEKPPMPRLWRNA
ncbi:ribonuclease H-like protein [Biscogniauxia marginata]|nr:ribonuclease H-like protein [Biscogniauxia marginata]